jgi:hypothetical protein
MKRYSAVIDEEAAMRSIEDLDDDLVEPAKELTGIQDDSALLQEALIERQASRLLAKQGGSDPDAQAGPRRRPMP